jgi:hypothetical protein
LWPEGTEAPSNVAIAWAHLVLQQLQTDGLLPTRVVASAEGGVGICFIDGSKYADIECLNSGAILGVTSDKRHRPIVWEVQQDAREIARAAQRIREFIFPSETSPHASAWSGRR